MKSIRTKIMSVFLLTVLLSLTLIGGISVFLNYNSTVGTLAQTMGATALTAAERVAQELDVYKSVTREVGCVPRLSEATASVAEKRLVVDQRVKTGGFLRGGVIDLNGVNLFDKVDYSAYDCVARSLKGETVVSKPSVNAATGELTVFVTAPIWANGIANGTVAGVVYFVPRQSFLNDIVTSIQVSGGASSYLIDQGGTTIAHKNMDNVMNQENTQRDAQSDHGLDALAELERKMTVGENGYGQYSYGGVNKFLAYAPIRGTGGWSIGINAPLNDFMGATKQGVLVTAVLFVLSAVAAVLVSVWLARSIGRPMTACAQRLTELSHGNLRAPVPEVKSKDEVGQLAEATKIIVGALTHIIADEEYLLGEMAKGNFDVRTRKAELYIGDFVPLLDSMRKINTDLSGTLAQIGQSSDQVASGSDQVSSGAQALSQGATEQAASVEELAATINEISIQINRNAQNASDATQRADEVGERMSESNRQMQHMVSAMNEIGESSSQISRIIKTIEDIAFQTNILALNAAVEAARAGAAGKGFAVVADEVRNLASKSAEASKNTATLIESSIRSVGNGTKIAQDTARSLSAVAEGTLAVVALIDKISAESIEQASKVSQITVGVDQISAVVQTNSATAQQSAAASEELSGQAQMLKDLVGRFVLRTDGTSSKLSYTEIPDDYNPKGVGKY